MFKVNKLSVVANHCCPVNLGFDGQGLVGIDFTVVIALYFECRP
jgi:hypothetical protein